MLLFVVAFACFLFGTHSFIEWRRYRFESFKLLFITAYLFAVVFLVIGLLYG